MNNKQLISGFNEAGLDVQFAIYETAPQLNHLLTDPGVLRFIAKLGGEEVFVNQFLEDMRVQLVLAGVILLTIGKQVNPQGYEQCFLNRVNTFGGVLGIATPQNTWTSSTAPSQRNMVAGYHFLSANFQLRREIFQVCAACARGTTVYNALFREVDNFLSGVEMGHIMMIDRYLFKRYRELLRWRLLADCTEQMILAWTYLAEKPQEERYYVKLLYPKEETAVLNRTNFSLYVATAQYETTSMKNYMGTQKDKVISDIFDEVQAYLWYRHSLSFVSVLSSEFSTLEGQEKN